MPHDVVLVPLKSFHLAKNRLRQAGTNEVTALAEELALGVLQGARPRTIFVLGESDDIESFAREQGVGFWRSVAPGLNPTVDGAYRAMSGDFDRFFIVHGDLHAPAGIGFFEPSEGVTIVTDHRQRGTNILVLPSNLDFHFSYGPDSKRLHQREAQRLGLACRVVNDSPWALDIDEPDDLVLGRKSTRGGPEAPSNTRPRTD